MDRVVNFIVPPPMLSEGSFRKVRLKFLVRYTTTTVNSKNGGVDALIYIVL